jgi:hypothetical protein
VHEQPIVFFRVKREIDNCSWNLTFIQALCSRLGLSGILNFVGFPRAKIDYHEGQGRCAHSELKILVLHPSSSSLCALSHTFSMYRSLRFCCDRSAHRDDELTSVGILLAAAQSVLPGCFTTTSTKPGGITQYTAGEPLSHIFRSRGPERPKCASFASPR